MIEFKFITVHPAMIDAYTSFGVVASAKRQGVASVSAINLRDFAVDKHGSIDDRPYGGGDSMIMRPEPLAAALQSIEKPGRVIFTTPGAKTFTHEDAVRLAQEKEPLTFVCGRFGGVDQRFIDKYVTEQFSLGEFVVSGGELPCLMIADAVLRQIPGVLGNADSASMDSYGAGLSGQIEAPQYTRPEEFDGERVPDVLLSGDHAAIEAWRKKNSK